MFLSNTHNLYLIIWFQVFLSNTNNLHTVFWFQCIFTNYPTRARCDTRTIFKTEFYVSEFTIFLLPDWLSLQSKIAQFSLQFTHDWRENRWIHAYPKCISVKGNANSLVQDLNSCHRVHLARGYPLHHEPLHRYVCMYVCVWVCM